MSKQHREFEFNFVPANDPCQCENCTTPANIEVKAKHRSERMLFCVQHARHMFPECRDRIMSVSMYPQGQSDASRYASSSYSDLSTRPLSLGCKVEQPVCSICEPKKAPEVAERILSQRSDPVYDKEDNPFQDDAILETRVVQHLSSRHGREVLTKVMRKMMKRYPGLAAKYLSQFMPKDIYRKVKDQDLPPNIRTKINFHMK